MYVASEEIEWLRNRVIQLEEELAQERDIRNRSLDLMMSGEFLRQRLMFQAIADGAFNHLVEATRPHTVPVS